MGLNQVSKLQTTIVGFHMVLSSLHLFQKHVDDHLDVVFDTSLLRAENLVLSPRYAMVMCFGFLTFGTSVSGTLGPVRRNGPSVLVVESTVLGLQQRDNMM